ncbi:hypothetical protein FXO38_14116 [Capsicum annuum]|nr:hypothetical protein FXO38_14116 [Capsicum annuum]
MPLRYSVEPDCSTRREGSKHRVLIRSISRSEVTTLCCCYNSRVTKPYRVARHQYVNTEEFIDVVADELKARLLKSKI